MIRTRQGSWGSVFGALIALSAVALVLGACSRQAGGGPTPSPQPERPGPAPSATSMPTSTMDNLAVALLVDRRLVVAQLSDGAAIAELPLGSAVDMPPIDRAGHYLALGQDGDTLLVLVPGSSNDAGQLAVVDIVEAKVASAYELPAGTTYGSLATGPATGRVYLFGNRAGGVVVTVLDPATGAEVTSWTAREADGHDWLVYQGAVAPDERTLYISYHGRDTTGIDRFAVTPDGLSRCGSANPPGVGCIDAHGGLAVDDGGLLVATGSRVIRKVDADGVAREALDTGLEDHLLEFVVDYRAGRLYAVAACDVGGGFSAVDVRGTGVLAPPATPGDWSWEVPPEPPLVATVGSQACGARLALGPSPLLVVGRTALPVPRPAPGELLIVDVRSGEVVRSVPTPAEPVDVLAIAR